MLNNALEKQKKYDWRIIQDGRIIIKPDGYILPFRDHRPTSTIIWTDGSQPNQNNSILTDPYFTKQSYPEVILSLQSMKMTLGDIGWIFITHPHGDHLLHIPHEYQQYVFPPFYPEVATQFSDITIVPLPGHHPELEAMVFLSSKNLWTWVVGDAILDEEWLRAWAYYFPNRYTKDEIILTWISVAKIITNADVIIPGHGSPIFVTYELVSHLLTSFSNAEFSGETRYVNKYLSDRLESFNRIG